MEAQKCVGLKTLHMVLVLVVSLTAVQYSGAMINRKIGIQFLSFSYVTGQLPDGSCCDGGQALPGGTCPPDTCDTAFVFCFMHKSNGSNCDPSFPTTPIVNNNTVNGFGKNLDPSVVNSTKALSTIPIFTMEPIEISVDIREVDPTRNGVSGPTLGNFSMLLNTTHLFTNHPDWLTFNYHNSVVRLSLNATSFCSLHFFGPFCNISCIDRSQHFDCNTDGNKICHKGYENVTSDCKTVTDTCVTLHQPCKNGATCHKLPNDFSCTCSPGYTGKACDTVIRSSISGSSQYWNSTSLTTLPQHTTAITSASSSGGLNIGVVLGPLAGLLLLGALALFLFLFYRKRKRTSPEEEKGEEDTEEGTANKDSAIPQSTAPQSTRPSQ